MSRIVLIAIISLSACGSPREARSDEVISQANAQSSAALRLSWHYTPDFADNLRFRIANGGLAALCVPGVATEEMIRFRQSGADVEPTYYDNRAILEWRGADLISGLVVIPPGKHFDIYYDLSKWRLKRGPTTASINLPVYDCLKFFQMRSPHAARTSSEFSFGAQPPAREQK